MSNTPFEAIQQAFVRARELPPGDRASLLAGLGATVRAEVESLLAADGGEDVLGPLRMAGGGRVPSVHEIIDRVRNMPRGRAREPGRPS